MGQGHNLVDEALPVGYDYPKSFSFWIGLAEASVNPDRKG